MTRPKIILASASTGRRKLLESLKIPFEVVESNIDEEKINPKNPIELVQKRARAKGESVELSLRGSRRDVGRRSNPLNKENNLIIAADSTVFLEKKSIGKPRNQNEGKQFLKLLSGKTHDFYTAIWVKDTETGILWEKVAQSKVTFRKLSNEDIERYASFHDLTKFAGAYAINDSPQDFVTKIEGSISNVIGLPLELILPLLGKRQLIGK